MTSCPVAGRSGLDTRTLLSEDALREPYDVYRQLRREQPIAYIDDQKFWLVSRYDDCEYVLEHPEIFSSREAVSSTNAYRRSPEALELLSRSKGHPRARTLIMSDPPDHTRYRAILQRALAPAKTLRELTPRIEATVHELIDGFCEEGRCEFVKAFAYPLPMRVVAALLDVADDQIDMLKAWSDSFISVQAGNIPPDRVVDAARRTIEFEEFILAKLEVRRRDAHDDLLGRLVRPAPGEEPLTTQELLNFALQILVGGNESTTNFLGNGMYRLLSTEGLIARLQSRPETIPSIVEEILRHDSPLQGLFRVALEEHELSGVTIPKGAKLMLSFGSANHDEAYYGHGDFDPDRDNRSVTHLAFGRGIHACAGQAFARREGAIAFAALVARLPHMRLSEAHPPERQTLFSLRGMKSLHVEFDPTPRRGVRS